MASIYLKPLFTLARVVFELPKCSLNFTNPSQNICPSSQTIDNSLEIEVNDLITAESLQCRVKAFAYIVKHYDQDEYPDFRLAHRPYLSSIAEYLASYTRQFIG